MTLICLYETNTRCKSDHIYVKTFMNYRYVMRSFHYEPIYMKTKTRIDSVEALKKIENIRKCFPGKVCDVVLFADTDSCSSIDDKRNQNLIEYARKNHFQIVWFNRDVESVFLGKRVKDSQKKREACNFQIKASKKDYNWDSLQLCDKAPLSHEYTSNIQLVLDKLLEESIKK